MTPLKLGILGLSEGNGHPYSWSAIFNGYDRDKMARCPFPVIPEYLARQEFPRDQLASGRVTHIWTQDASVSRDVAEASLIEHVVDDYRDMIGQVEGILLARDDAENHLEMSKPFIKAGLPIYIDKPLALSREEAGRILDLQTFEDQIFSCSALGFAPEFQLAPEELAALGKVREVDARIGNSWAKYAVHIIEPTLNLAGDNGEIRKCTRTVTGDECGVTVSWDSGLETRFTTTGGSPTPPQLNIAGERRTRKLVFTDAFGAFKAALERFVSVARGESRTIPRRFLMQVMQIVETGVGRE